MTPHHLTIPPWFVDFVLLRRRWILGFVLVSALAGSLIAARTPFRTSILHGFMRHEGEYEDYRQRVSALGGTTDDVILLATREGGDLFAPRTLDAIRAAARQMQSLPEIDSVQAFVDAPWLAPNRRLSLRETAARARVRRMMLRGEAPELGEFKPLPYWPADKRRQDLIDLPALREAMTGLDPLVSGLISRDGTAQAMVIKVAEQAPRDSGAPFRLARRLESVARQSGLGKHGIYTAGVMVTEGGMLREALRGVYLLFPIGAVVICVLVYAVFRRFSLVGLTMVIALVAISWSLGITALAFGEITLLVAGAPLLILVIGTSDTVHIASAYFTELDRGETPENAVRRTVADVGGACVLSSITTFVGFLSLMVIPAITLRHASLSIAIGVASALLLAFTLCPIALSSLKVGRKRHSTIATAWVNSIVTRSVGLCKNVSMDYPRSVLAATALLMTASILLTTRLTLDVDFPKRFPDGHDVRRGVTFFNEQFAGANTIEIFLSGDDELIASPETVAALQRAEQRLLDRADTRQAVSLATLVGTVDRLLAIPDNEPLTQARIDGVLKIMHAASPEGLQSVLARNYGLARVTIQITPTRIFHILDLARDAERIYQEELPVGIRVEASGAYPIIAGAAKRILIAQYEGAAICFLSVITIVGLGARSLRLALLAVLPNVLPLVCLGGLLGATHSVIDSDILGVVIVSFGLAVDDTIHFLHRYDLELGRTKEVRAALGQTFDYTGLAIFRTTIILCAGLAPFALSGYVSLAFLGTYLVFAVACAVLGDLLLLPSMVLLFDKRYKDTTVPH